MSLIVRIFRDALGRPTEHDNRFVVEADPDGDDGGGTLVTTPDPSEAKAFDSVQEVREYWMRPSTVRPLRGDRKPNRPLTAYNIIVESMEWSQPEEE